MSGYIDDGVQAPDGREFTVEAFRAMHAGPGRSGSGAGDVVRLVRYGRGWRVRVRPWPPPIRRSGEWATLVGSHGEAVAMCASLSDLVETGRWTPADGEPPLMTATAMASRWQADGMTEPVQSGGIEFDPWQRRCEVVALAGVVAAAAVIVGALLQMAGPGAEFHLTTRQRLMAATSAGNGLTALFVIAAVLLVWLAPGEFVTPLGERVVMPATIGLSVIVFLEAATGIVSNLTARSDGLSGQLVWRFGVESAHVTGAVLGAVALWLAIGLFRELRASLTEMSEQESGGLTP